MLEHNAVCCDVTGQKENENYLYFSIVVAQIFIFIIIFFLRVYNIRYTPTHVHSERNQYAYLSIVLLEVLIVIIDLSVDDFSDLYDV